MAEVLWLAVLEAGRPRSGAGGVGLGGPHAGLQTSCCALVFGKGSGALWNLFYKALIQFMRVLSS